MFSSLDDLRHSTSCAISSNVKRQPPSTFARNLKELRHSNPGVQVRPLSHQFSFRINSNVDIDLNYINYYVFKKLYSTALVNHLHYGLSKETI